MALRFKLPRLALRLTDARTASPPPATRPAPVQRPAKSKGIQRPLTSKNLTQTLPFAEPDDGVVFLRGGEKVWFGIELSPGTSAQVDEGRARALSEAIRVMINQAIPMTEGGRLIIERVPAPRPYVDHFLGPSTASTSPLLSRIMEAEREDIHQARLRGEITTTRFFLTLYVTVPKRPKHLPLTERQYREQMDKVSKRRSSILARLQGIGLYPAVMSNRETKWLIWRYLNGNMVSATPPDFTSKLDLRDFSEQGLKHDRGQAPLTTRYQVAETEIGTSHPGYLTMGDRLINIISLEKGGGHTGETVIDQLLMAMQNRHFYVMVDFEHLRQGEMRAKLDSAVDDLEGASNDPTLRAGEATSARAQRVREAIHDAEYLGRHFWRLGITTVLYAKTREELTDMLEMTRSEYSMMSGAHAFISNEQLKRTFFDVMPFSSALTQHRVSGDCANVADMFPKIAPWLGTAAPQIALRNRHGGLTGLNLREGGTNFGVMVLGSSGGGKSVFNMNILLNMVPRKDRAFILDPKRDYHEATLSLGGSVIPINPDGRLEDGRPARINIFDPTPGEDQPSPEKTAYLIAVFRVLDLVPDVDHQTVLTAALQQFYMIRSRRVPDPDHPGETREVYMGGRLGQFVQILSTLSRNGTQGLSPALITVRDRLSSLMQQYLAGGGGVLGDFLDCETTVNVHAPCVCFDTQKMYEDPTMRSLGILMVGEYMFQQASRLPGGKIGIFEELGVLSHIPELAQLVNRWFKTGRSMGMIPIGTAQDTKDFARLGGLINNSAWVVLASVGGSEVDELTTLMNLSPKVAELAASLTLRPGVMGEYLILQKVADGIHVGDVGQLWMSPEKLWTVTTNHDEKERRTLYTQNYGSREEAILQLAAEVRSRRKG